MATRKPYTMYVLSHTHWDREWYQPFQGYRRRLVFQTDAMMDLLDQRPEYPSFHLDGQTSVLDDYLEIRPEGRARLAALIRAGRVLVGPWYTMPDECHLSGESLIRNLALGHRLCAAWGTRPMHIGWVSDVFSHVSQFPQILAGFGLDCAYMHHGTPCTEHERTELAWEGADGTEILIIKAYPWYGYQDILQMRYRTREELHAFERKQIARATTPVLLGLDGNDHEPAKWDTPEVVARLNALFAQTRVIHASMPDYLRALRRALGPRWQRGLQRVTGELRVPAKTGNWNGLTNGTGSSRLPLKQMNDAQEWLLARLAEPLNAWASLLGGEPQRAYLDRAWKYLFLNHPHDSICGCSVDQPHRDMVYRFDQARMLAEDSLDDSVQAVADCIDPAAFRGADYIVTAFNPGIAATGPVTRVAFEVPAPVVRQRAAAGLVPVLQDAAGAPLAYDVVRVERGVRARPCNYKERGISPALTVKRDYPVDRYHVAVCDSIPALGYKTWRIAFRPAATAAIAAPAPRLRAVAAAVSAAGARLENAHVRLVAHRDGRVDLYDKATRTWFRGLHAFEDVGDAGEGWNHAYPTRDTVVLSTNPRARGRVRLARGRRSPLAASITVALALRVPADLVNETPDRKQRQAATARSRATVTLPIETTFTLHADSRLVECRTSVVNRARCHRLRVLFPTGRRTDAWYGDTALDLVRRPVRLRDTTGWKERDREECPIKNVVAACDRRAGLAVLTKGLYEAAVQDNATRTIALTLFRGFVEHLFFEKTVDSLLLGELATEYALLPFTPERGAPPAGLQGEIDRYKLALPAYTRPASGEPVDPVALPPCSEDNPPQPAPSVGTDVIPLSRKLVAILAARPQPRRDLPPSGALVTLGAPLALSTIKTAEDGKGIVLRVWNPTTRAVRGEVRAGFAFREAALTDLLERPVRALASRGGAVRFMAGRKQIVTIRFDR